MTRSLTGRKLEAVRTEQRIKADGLLDEEAWLLSNVAGDFIMYNPYNGIASKYRTEVRVLYDDEALYIGAMMYDDSPDSIYNELGARDDDNINSDNFYVEISPFNDGLNGEVFKVTASGVQIDNKLSTGDSWDREDTWDAVWESRTAILENGWSAEIRIPYSALRFSKAATQMWGINFWREVRRDRETSSWNFVTEGIWMPPWHIWVSLGDLKRYHSATAPFPGSVCFRLSAEDV
ncbi:MAG: carbohydrate binding family 9 domain-containing protein [Marinilabiliales bacterium]|nr:carbohydrate binding family 9 domain-containing protein [Marinilabiliales bacterium]